MEDFTPKIGLEIHARMATRTKAFCSCRNEFREEPNKHVCPVCMGHPGALPSPNSEFVLCGMVAAMMAGANINRHSRFVRKNYFYPDLPKGYQITQAEMPLARGGTIKINTGTGIREIALEQIHIEEDAGRTIYNEDELLLDFNRCGVPLIEFVTGPCIESPAEAAEVFRELRRMTMFADICPGDMQKGDLRCDANISLTHNGKKGVRTEIKNLNSFRFLTKALESEIRRQKEILNAGGSIISETMTYDEAENITRPMRGKESAPDYRYFPEPDIPRIILDEYLIKNIYYLVPELPAEAEAELSEKYGIGLDTARELTKYRHRLDFFRECAENTGKNIKKFAIFMINIILPERETENGIGIDPKDAAELFDMVENEELSSTSAPLVLAEIAGKGESARAIATRMELLQISDADYIDDIVRQIVKENPEAVEKYKSGRDKALGYLVGKAMRASRGRANPKIVSRRLKEII